MWNASYDLNRNTDQVGVDATNPVYAKEIGVRNFEYLDIAGSGASGRMVTLGADYVAAITQESDFDRSLLSGLGHTLFVNVGAGNGLTLSGAWTDLGSTLYDGVSYAAYQQAGELLLVACATGA